MDLDGVPELETAYSEARGNPSDIWQHVETLRNLASTCASVAELVERPIESTAAFLKSGAVLVSVSANHTPKTMGLISSVATATGMGHVFIHAHSLREDVNLPEVDLLFIDTFKTKDRLASELAKHAGKAKKYIALHDTVTWGHVGEDGRDGVWPAVSEFLRMRPEWRVIMHHVHNNGLTVLGRVT